MITSKDTILYLNFFFFYMMLLYFANVTIRKTIYLCSQMCMNIKL